MVNLLQLQPEEQVTAVINIRKETTDGYLFMATKRGIVKKTALSEYANIRKTGLQAINLREDDDLIEVKLTNNENDVFLITKNGMCIRFNEKDVRPTGSASLVVIGITIDDTY